MKSLWLLLWDEFVGFIKSKIMIALWIGLPILTVILHLASPNTEGIPLSIFNGLIIASIGGFLAAVMLSTTMVNEINAKVYDLFLIRPVKRWQIIIAKYVAVFLCLTLTSLLSLGFGLFVDYITKSLPSTAYIFDIFESFIISVSAMSISCVLGILIGILIKSVGLAAILSIYFGQQVSLVTLLPGIFFNIPHTTLFIVGLSFGITVLVLGIDIIIFNKKQF
ncbi:MAG: hypothetical protein U9O98_05200 [Asgard group archaeon]|nr:hypothetical protein [Asgard group archaeon]